MRNSVTSITRPGLLAALLLALGSAASPLHGQQRPLRLAIEGGWYRPSMDYWNERSTFAGIDRFDGSGLFGAAVVAQVAGPLAVRVSAGYWRAAVHDSTLSLPIEITRREAEVTLVPVGAALLVRPASLRLAGLRPYAGAGASLVFVRKQVTHVPVFPDEPPARERDSGRDFLATVEAGVEAELGPRQGLTLALRYAFGGYDESVGEDGAPLATERVSLAGSQVVLGFWWSPFR
ncbi:MAG TPA: hypothetical protein VEW03_08910 [Longimicrobiaceae bacterium]|nr:hypothetical protein [Longimicrobiaceae bacterium]